jgi:crossover junction endodeoxyribonuclease RuvC
MIPGPPASLIILGVDPSSTSTGYGILDGRRRRFRYVTCGCIRPRRGEALEDRLVLLHERLAAVIAEHRPDVAAIERTFVGRDATAAAILGQARGVLLLALRQAGLPVSHYTPAEVKKAVVGNGQATKEQVQFMVTKLLGLPAAPVPLDASDALAVGLCHAFQVGQRLPSTKDRPSRPEIDALLRRMVRR